MVLNGKTKLVTSLGCCRVMCHADRLAGRSPAGQSNVCHAFISHPSPPSNQRQTSSARFWQFMRIVVSSNDRGHYAAASGHRAERSKLQVIHVIVAAIFRRWQPANGHQFLRQQHRKIILLLGLAAQKGLALEPGVDASLQHHTAILLGLELMVFGAKTTLTRQFIGVVGAAPASHAVRSFTS